MSNSPTTAPRIGIVEALRFLRELFAVVSLVIWGFRMWQLPWNIVLGIGLPLVAILLWALFRSPRAVFGVDIFVKALVEIVVMGTAAFAWADMGQWWVAGLFAVVAVVTGLIVGRREV